MGYGIVVATMGHARRVVLQSPKSHHGTIKKYVSLSHPLLPHLTSIIVWSCGNNPKNCSCWMLDEKKAEAIEWMTANGNPPIETPHRKRKRHLYEDIDPSSTPWTIAKQKSASRDNSDQERNEGGPSSSFDDSTFEGFEDLYNDSPAPSQRPAKRARESTPCPSPRRRSGNVAADSLPTPDTGSQPMNNSTSSRSRARNSVTPTPAPLGSAIQLTSHLTSPLPNSESSSSQPSPLTTQVLHLLASEHVFLKESTKIQLSHLIDLEVELSEVKIRRTGGTIERLCGRVDGLAAEVEMRERKIEELEGRIEEWMGPIVLSD